jgi:hypothetical protein
MDLEQLNKIDTSNPDQVKALQTFLKTRGYYNGPIDGKWGGGTTAGAARVQADLKADADRQLETERARTAGKEAEARGKEAENDPTARVTKMGTEVAPYVAGVGIGTAAGHFFGKRFAAQDKASGQGVGRLANEKGLDPNVREAQLNRLNRERGRRNISQFGAPAALGAMGYATRNVIAPAFSDPQTQDIIKSVGTGENAAAATLGVHQLVSTLGRGNPNDPVDEARIRSRPATPPPDAPPALRTPADRLTAAAKAAGATGAQAKTKAAAVKYLESNVTPEVRAAVAAELGVGPGQKITSAIKKLSTSRKPSVIIAPLVGAAAAYDAASSDAEAAGATPAEARTRGAVAGTGATAVAGGALYGASKLPAALRSAGGRGLSMLAPFAASDMSDAFANSGKGFTPEEIQASENQTLNTTARNTPNWFNPGAVGGAREMATVPEPSPVRSQLSGFAAERAGPLSSASALQIPEGIPLPRADGASPYAEAQPARAASGDERFDTALKEWLGLIQEHNSSLQGAQ